MAKPFRLSKDEDARRAKLAAALSKAREKLDLLVEDANDAVATAADKLSDGIEAYNEVLEEARGFILDIVSQAEEDFGDKSEKWQEGDAGSVAREWIGEWESALQADAEVEIPGPLVLDFDDHAEELEALPSEAE